MKVIKILNYGSGNIGSIISTLTSIGFPSSSCKGGRYFKF